MTLKILNGADVALARTVMGDTQAQMATRLGIDAKTLRDTEKAEDKPVKPMLALAIERLLETSTGFRALQIGTPIPALAQATALADLLEVDVSIILTAHMSGLDIRNTPAMDRIFKWLEANTDVNRETLDTIRWMHKLGR